MRRTIVLALVLVVVAPSALLRGQSEHRQILREKTDEALRQIVRGSRDVMGMAAVDLTSGERFGINDTLVFPQGSAIKIPVLMEVWKQAREGRFSLHDKTPVPKSAVVGGSGILQFLGEGFSEFSVRDLAVLMIMLSDNTATNMLIDRVGKDRINATMASLGLVQTRVQRRMINEAASARGEENLSTPREAARIMELLYTGSFLDRRACDEMLTILKFPKEGAIKKGVPASVEIAFKPGGIAGVRTEWAIVYAEARPFAVAIMENYLPADDQSSAMKEIGTVLYDYFWRIGHATKYGTYVNPTMLKP